MILIIGVTASGKGQLAFDLAKTIDAEIISVDSMKVYQRMDIGTAKPPKTARREIKYHLLDVAEPSESFSVARFLHLANQAIDQIKSRHKSIVAVGGTALYIKALLYGLFEGPGSDEKIRAKLKHQTKECGTEKLYEKLKNIDPEAADRIHPNDAKRIIRALEVFELTGKPISSFQKQWNEPDKRHDWTIIGLRREKPEENRRINRRVKNMLAQGLIDEVKSLLAEQKPLSPQAQHAIGYAEIIDYLNGRTTLEDAAELIKKNTRRLAKSQRTWFKTFKNVNWLDLPPQQSPKQLFDDTLELIQKLK